MYFALGTHVSVVISFFALAGVQRVSAPSAVVEQVRSGWLATTAASAWLGTNGLKHLSLVVGQRKAAGGLQRSRRRVVSCAYPPFCRYVVFCSSSSSE
jgi:hypothetical protein